MLPEPAQTRLGDHLLTGLRGAVLGLLDLDPAVAKDLATLKEHSKILLATLNDIVTLLEPRQPGLCRAEFFIELAARAWKATPDSGDHKTPVGATVAFLDQLAGWLGRDGLAELKEGQSLSRQVLDLFSAVRRRIRGCYK